MCVRNKMDESMKKNKKKRYRFPKGYTPWNKGLTKETDKRLIRTEEYKKSISGKGNSFYGKKHTIKSKNKISRNRIYFKGKENPSFGKHIWEFRENPKGMLGKKNRWGKHTKEAIEKVKKARAKQILPTKDTSIEVKIQNFLKQLGIEFFTHQYIKIEHGYQCDILIPSMNLVIECDGDYWHKYPIGRDIDNVRTKELIEKGFKVLRLWEFEINEMSIKQFEGRLKNDKTRQNNL